MICATRRLVPTSHHSGGWRSSWGRTSVRQIWRAQIYRAGHVRTCWQSCAGRKPAELSPVFAFCIAAGGRAASAKKAMAHLGEHGSTGRACWFSPGCGGSVWRALRMLRHLAMRDRPGWAGWPDTRWYQPHLNGFTITALTRRRPRPARTDRHGYQTRRFLPTVSSTADGSGEPAARA